jgi:hypothetical protein
MSEQRTVELQACRVRFFSPNDEQAFFKWMGALSCVKAFAGRGDTIYLTVDKSLVDDDALRELLALFHRYCIGMEQLRVFDRPEFAEWFRNSGTYWFQKVFGVP